MEKSLLSLSGECGWKTNCHSEQNILESAKGKEERRMQHEAARSTGGFRSSTRAGIRSTRRASGTATRVRADWSELTMDS